MRLVRAAERLREATAGVALAGNAAFVYAPLEYAWDPHAAYLRAYGQAQGRVLLVGMNPGPWGMGQTGVPFADPAWAAGWMGVRGEVRPPPRAHPKRPVLGFASTRRDPSGLKLYGWAQRRFGTAEAFFARFFVTNLCPVLFLDEAGRNVPLPALPRADREALEARCDAWLAAVLRDLAPARVVALGAYVDGVARRVRDAEGLDAPVSLVRHPSPANPGNNAGWGDEVDALTGA